MTIATEDLIASQINDPCGSKAGRKPKRIGPDGKPMRRLVVVLSSTEHTNVVEAISLRLHPLFSKYYNGDKIVSGDCIEESQGRALAAICKAWRDVVES